MSATCNSDNDSLSASRWKLWVDGCGGFLLLDGDRWTVGGIDHASSPDICVRADWPRRSGTIIREGADYFWQPFRGDTRLLIQFGKSLPTGGTAAMTLTCPSPLSNSAVLSLRGPHRFDGHVDAVILVDQVLLMGPKSDCHIRTTEFPDQIVLMLRQGQWQAKIKDQNTFYPLPAGQRVSVGTLAMTLEPA